MQTKKHQDVHSFIASIQSMKADALMGFIAGFLVGVIGMYVYASIISSF